MNLVDMNLKLQFLRSKDMLAPGWFIFSLCSFHLDFPFEEGQGGRVWSLSVTEEATIRAHLWSKSDFLGSCTRNLTSEGYRASLCGHYAMV